MSNAATSQDFRDLDLGSLRLPWTSTNSHPDDVARQVANLYVSLYNAANLPTKEVAVASGETVSGLAYELEFFTGPYFPVELDALLCDLNPHICARELEAFDGDASSQVSEHLGAYQISPGKWSLSPGDSVRVIDLELHDSLDFAARVIPIGYSVQDVLNRDAMDCTEYGSSCAEIVKKLNPSLEEFDDPSDGTLTAILPTRRVTALIPIRDGEAVDALFERYQFVVPDGEPRRVDEIEFNNPSLPHGASPQPIPSSILTQGINQLEDNLFIRGGPGQLDSAFDNLHPANRDLLKLTGHPFDSLQGTVGGLVSESATIGVIDNWIDADHCHLLGRIELIGALAQVQVDRDSTCYVDALGGPDSHGTHVVGTITGGADQARFVGLFPQSKVVFAAADVESLGRTFAANENVKRDLNAMFLNHDARVINVSWDYQSIGDNDPILRAIVGLGNATLIVASAGNYAMSFSRDGRGCTWEPACLSYLPNVISVVGLTGNLADPDIYEKGNRNASGSNYGTAFDIAALGENVLSTVNGNGIGPMSGTSTAAPQVAAAAGLLHAVFRQNHQGDMEPGPWMIKNRLMYSSDLFPELLESVYSGRLNIARALAIDETQAAFDDEPGKVYSGEVIEHPDIVKCRNGDVDIDIPWRSLRRMSWNDRSNSLIVFYEEKVQRPALTYFELKRIPNCVLLTQTNALTLQPFDGGAPIARQMIDVRDLLLRI